VLLSVLSHAFWKGRESQKVAHRKGRWTVLLGGRHLDRMDIVQNSLSCWRKEEKGEMSDSRYRAGLTAYQKKKAMANQRVGMRKLWAVRTRLLGIRDQKKCQSGLCSTLKRIQARVLVAKWPDQPGRIILLGSTKRRRVCLQGRPCCCLSWGSVGPMTDNTRVVHS
jgi:hypothetical protein